MRIWLSSMASFVLTGLILRTLVRLQGLAMMAMVIQVTKMTKMGKHQTPRPLKLTPPRLVPLKPFLIQRLKRLAQVLHHRDLRPMRWLKCVARIVSPCSQNLSCGLMPNHEVPSHRLARSPQKMVLRSQVRMLVTLPAPTRRRRVLCRPHPFRGLASQWAVLPFVCQQSHHLGWRRSMSDWSKLGWSN